MELRASEIDFLTNKKHKNSKHPTTMWPSATNMTSGGVWVGQGVWARVGWGGVGGACPGWGGGVAVGRSICFLSEPGNKRGPVTGMLNAGVCVRHPWLES